MMQSKNDGEFELYIMLSFLKK